MDTWLRLAIVLCLFCRTCFSVAYAAPLTGSASSAPAAQTELSQQGNSLKVDIFGPIKGLQTNVSDIARDGDYARVLDNLHMFKRGVWSDRGGGIEELEEIATVDDRVMGMCPVIDDSGEEHIIVQAGDTIYLWENDGSTAPLSMMDGTPATVSNDPDDIPDIKQYDSETVVYVNGNEEVPLFWDGDVTHGFDPLHGTGKPAFNSIEYDYPKYQDNFAGRLVTAGYTGTEGQPYAVVFSQFGDVDNYATPTGLATDAGVITFPAALGKITGIRSMRLDTTGATQVLLVGMERGMGVITGKDALDFEGAELTREFGLLSHRSWATIGNEVYFCATDGVRKISSSLGTAAIAIAPITFSLTDIYGRINRDFKHRIFALQHSKTQEVTWFLPIDDREDPEEALVMNYNVDVDGGIIAPTRIDKPVFSTLSQLAFHSLYGDLGPKYQIACALDFKDQALIGYGDGVVCQGYTGDNYRGRPIRWTYVSPYIGANSPAQEASCKKIVVMTEGERQKFDAALLTVSTLADGTTTLITRSLKTYDTDDGNDCINLSPWTRWSQENNPIYDPIGGAPPGFSEKTYTYPRFIDVSAPGSGRLWVLWLASSAFGDESNGDQSKHIDLVGIQSILTVGGWRQ